MLLLLLQVANSTDTSYTVSNTISSPLIFPLPPLTTLVLSLSAALQLQEEHAATQPGRDVEEQQQQHLDTGREREEREGEETHLAFFTLTTSCLSWKST